MTPAGRLAFTLARVDERGIDEIEIYLRRLRAAGLIAIGGDDGDGVSIADAVTVLIALSATVSSVDAAIAVRNFRPLRPTIRTGVADERFLPPAVIAVHDFGAALEALVDEAPILEKRFTSRRQVLRLECQFAWGNFDAGAIRVYGGQELRAEIVFLAPDADAGHDDFYDRRMAVTVGLPTFLALAGVVDRQAAAIESTEPRH